MDGELFYYKNGKWLDSHFVAVPTTIMHKLNKLVLDSDDFKMKSAEELLDIILYYSGVLQGLVAEELPRLLEWVKRLLL